jgi:hypothetical protein
MNFIADRYLLPKILILKMETHLIYSIYVK